MAKDYYALLGVSREATTEEIKKSFRKVARETHPDTNPGDSAAEAKFRDAAEAYEVLSDPERRARYNRGDKIDLNDLFNGLGGIDDLLRSVFGEGGLLGSRQRAVRGRDVLVRTEVSLEEAAFGGDAIVEYEALGDCERCSASGSEPGSVRVTCSHCGGAGRVRMAQRSIFGSMMSVVTCEHCNGEGSMAEDPCHDCHGSGATARVSKISVEIPPGVSSGTRLRLSGRGESGGRVGAPGDLYVEVSVADDERFERRDSDLIHRTTIGFAEATLGTRIEIPLIDGNSKELDVPRGTAPGHVFRIRGQGMSVLGRRSRGNLLVVVDVEVPESLTTEEEEALRRWAEIRGERTNRPASAK